MVQISETNSLEKTVNYKSSKIQLMKDGLIFTFENFWQCVNVKTDDYVLKDVANKINVQRKKFFNFVEDSIQQSYKIRRYLSNFQLVIECSADDSLSKDEYVKELESLLDESKRNLKSAEMLNKQAEEIIDELININSELYKYKEDIQSNTENIKSENGDKFNKTKSNMKFSTFLRNCGVAVFIGAGALALAPYTGGASVVIGSELAEGLFVGSTILGTEAAIFAVAGEVSRQECSSKIDKLREQLEKEKVELSTNIDKLIEGLKLIVDTAAMLMVYWKTQSDDYLVYLLNKANEAKEQQTIESNGNIDGNGQVGDSSSTGSNVKTPENKPLFRNKPVVRGINKCLKEMEVDELYTKEFSMEIGVQMVKYEMMFNRIGM
ncbi:769_t:CDS:2 [Scutellospora calospora]|uniref:769_t:CDS:1 n=1 Tax=Scutellospora calospora TaxID=85575 RepID=A0ACA9L5G5_9GLOM|nr:769_t:CDS:2 [Scutellospora calospora]